MKNDLIKLARRLSDLGLRDEALTLVKAAQQAAMTDEDIANENMERSKANPGNYFKGNGDQFVSTYCESIYGVKNTPQEFKSYAVQIGYNPGLVSKFLATVKPYDPNTGWENYVASLEALASSLGIKP